MRLFFLTKLLRSFYGNLSKKHFLWFCQICLSKKSWAFLYFIWIFELRLPMFIYWAGLSWSLAQATQWVAHGFVKINNRTHRDLWKPIQLYDFITFDKSLWNTIILTYVKVLFYAYKSIKVYKCRPRYWKRYMTKLNWAHFMPTPRYVYFDSWTMSLYWWWEPTMDQFKYYFSINISSIMKYITI